MKRITISEGNGVDFIGIEQKDIDFLLEKLNPPTYGLSAYEGKSRLDHYVEGGSAPLAHPHIPYGILDGTMSVKEVNTWRAGETIKNHLYWGRQIYSTPEARKLLWKEIANLTGKEAYNDLGFSFKEIDALFKKSGNHMGNPEFNDNPNLSDNETKAVREYMRLVNKYITFQLEFTPFNPDKMFSPTLRINGITLGSSLENKITNPEILKGIGFKFPMVDKSSVWNAEILREAGLSQDLGAIITETGYIFTTKERIIQDFT